MLIFRTIFLILVATIFLTTNSRAQGSVQPGDVFISPDKTHSLKIEDYNRVYHFVVKNLSSGKIASFEDEYNPIFAIRWTSDSKSIFIAAHYARGKLLYMIHNDAHVWKLEEITPREDREYESEILDWKFEKDVVQLSFKVMIYSKTSPEFYKCTFDFDPSTGVRSSYKKVLISSDAYSNTKSLLAPD